MRVKIVELLGYDDKVRATRVRALCPCGTIFASTQNHIRSGHTRSCGCLKRGVRSTRLPSPVRGARWIPLTQGKFALVDTRDYTRVSARLWLYIAPSCGRSGYVCASGGHRRGEKRLRLHHFVLGVNSSDEVDHCNLDGLDNRRRNLRLATSSLNKANTSLRKDNTTGHKGVVRRKQRWIAQIGWKGQMRYLGTFKTFEEAVAKRERAATSLFGKFARERA